MHCDNVNCGKPGSLGCHPCQEEEKQVDPMPLRFDTRPLTPAHVCLGSALIAALWAARTSIRGIPWPSGFEIYNEIPDHHGIDRPRYGPSPLRVEAPINRDPARRAAGTWAASP